MDILELGSQLLLKIMAYLHFIAQCYTLIFNIKLSCNSHVRQFFTKIEGDVAALWQLQGSMSQLQSLPWYLLQGCHVHHVIAT